MDLVVDRVSEDSFYENILIGLPQVLENLLNIFDQHIERNPSVPHSSICNWEQKHGVLLPEDLRSFYMSNNGFLYSYKFYYKEEATEENIITGKIEINPLSELNPIYGYEIKNSASIDFESPKYELKLGPESKIFELVRIDNDGKVALVYVNPKFLPTIWVQNSNMEFSFLAHDFTTYFRMAVHHLGIPFWQFAFTREGVPQWSEMMFRLLIPGVLPLGKKIEDLKRQLSRRSDDDFSDLPVNKIDPGLFRFAGKLYTQIPSNIAPTSSASPRSTKKAQGGKSVKNQRKPLYQSKK